MNQKERMLAGLPYKAWLDGLSQERQATKQKIFDFNHLSPAELNQTDALIKEIIGTHGDSLHIEAPFHCDYGSNIEIGNNFFANYHCVMLDVAKITIGENVMFAPNVSLYTAGHPLHPVSRNSGYEYGLPITIGDNVWLGGNVIVNPGVTIGDNVVVGSGSVVTKDLPDNVVAVGNPCQIIREITDEDRDFYYRKERFDVSDY